jgi:pyruvate kinase
LARRTKIVCTLGPAVDSRAKIKALIGAGMNVARINCSFGDWDTRKRWIGWIRELSPECGPVGVLVDLQGPKFRLDAFDEPDRMLREGALVNLGPGKKHDVPLSRVEILESLERGDRILVGDGEVELRVAERDGKSISAKVVGGGSIKPKQGVTVVGKVFQAPAITEQDRNDVAEACKAGVDLLALSYVRSPEDIAQLRELVRPLDPAIRLCAKIETRQAVRLIDGIARASDVVMVARGDLGLQMEIEKVPAAQKLIIRKCNDLAKPVITATQMLESMLRSPRPTRSEAADVANAILDGTDAVMLSGETAVGEFPVKTVETMSRVAAEAESLLDNRAIMRRFLESRSSAGDSPAAISYAVAQLAELTRPAAILTTSISGQTARLVSKYRPRSKLLCATSDSRTLSQLSVVWGVEAILLPLPKSTDENVANAMESFKARRRLKVGDTVVVTAGVPVGTPGNTNLILVMAVK